MECRKASSSRLHRKNDHGGGRARLALQRAQKRLKITRRESGHCVSPSISVARGADFFSRRSFERNRVSQGGCEQERKRWCAKCRVGEHQLLQPTNAM